MKIFKLILILFLISLVNDSFAQRFDDKSEFKDEIDKIMKQKLIDGLSIDETTADKVILSYKEHKNAILNMDKEKRDLIESIELDPGASDIDNKLDNILEIETKIVEQRKSFFKELRTFLTPQQVAKTWVLRKNFDKRLRREIQKQRKGNFPDESPGENDQ